MDIKTTFVKTTKGKDEIERRSAGLAFKQRRVLILVDGKSTVADLQSKSAGMADLADVLEELLHAGYVEPVGGGAGAVVSAPIQSPAARADPGDSAASGAATPGAAAKKDRLIQVATEILGADGDKVIKKLRAAPDTDEGLRSCLDACRKVIRLTVDEAKADELYLRGRQTLS
ncbi:MAG: hypothetical protein B7Z66_01020 [Chromatiales bacterium 21-64-14]|nr:MAG: hypothetical protein B7Z66_01020 [Chromatiales bacterium 21-64-14]HQU16047.1 hypothetical protein [Gammaproteobacteria bacterium]